MKVCFVLLLFDLSFCVYVLLRIHCGSAIVLGISRSPYYCTPLVCVVNFPGGLGGVVIIQTNKQTNKFKAKYITGTNKLIYHTKMVNEFKKILQNFLHEVSDVEMVHNDLYSPGKFKAFTLRWADPSR